MLLYAATLSWLSLERHAAHESNALDLGYYNNTLWNTIHGAPFHFTTFHEAAFHFPEFDPKRIRQPENLLSYHVEPLLLLVAPLYLIWPDPRALLILQSVILASGAWPAYQIARRRYGPGWLSVACCAMYLLSPSLAGANLADFHPVTLCAAFFLWAFDALEQKRLKTALIFTVLILAAKEEMGLLVALLWLYGLYRQVASGVLSLSKSVRQRSVQIGVATIAAAVAWTASAAAIQQSAAGRTASVFAARYSWLGHSVPEVARNILTTPILLDWLKQPEVYGYLGFLLAQTGFMALFAPEVLLLALPEIGINTFSRFDWMRSGVAHYSAPIVPFLIIAAIIGAERLGRRWLRWLPRGIPVVFALCFALTQSYRAGAIPFTADFAAYTVTPHQQKLAGLAARIPPEARLSAQSDLYPHVSARANAYLFPTVGDADIILLDVSGQTYPASPADYAQTVKQILNETPVSIVEADDGYLLLARGAALRPTPGAGVPRLPETFFSFLRADPSSIQQPLHVRFGDSLELLGYNLEIVPPRAVPAPAVRLRTYWRALRPPVENARFVFHVYAPTGYEAYAQADSPAELWYPTSRWSVGETVVVAQRALQVAHGGRVGVSVEWGDGQEVIPQGVDGNAEIAGTTLMLVTVR